MSARRSEPTEGEIRLRAYRIWQWLGCPDGYETEIWARAEKELRTEAAREEAPEPLTPVIADVDAVVTGGRVGA